MKIVVSGASGLIGSALVSVLARDGHDVIRLVRGRQTGGADVRWDPSLGEIDAAALAGAGAAVHLAGETIAGRWSAAKKSRIMESRSRGTRLLAETLARLTPRPSVLVSTSASGYYGDRGDEVLTEQSGPGTGFLATVCRAWEGATASAAEAGVRVAILRLGVVLSAQGGALRQMLPPFRFGLGGVLGSGRQYMSWIALDDAVSAIRHALATESLSGPVNAASPYAATNREFTKALGHVLGRPTFMPLPAFAVRLMFGELADEGLLASQRLDPARLQASGYTFRYPELEPALRAALGKP